MQASARRSYLRQCLDKAFAEVPLTDGEVVFLLGLEDGADLEHLFRAARDLRYRFFGNKVFLYGFIYYSTWCRNNCSFCYYRVSNRQVERYRKSPEEAAAAAVNLASSGVHLLDLTMGEDPFYYRTKSGMQRILELVGTIKLETDLPLMISPGAVSRPVLAALAREGVDWYACYQETHNIELFRRLRLNQDYALRMRKKRFARELGFLIEEGILTGIGETLPDIARSMQAMREIGAHQVRVMSFVPQAGTPREKEPPPPRLREMKIIAVMRLLFPGKLIPASLDVDGIGGLAARMNAGANVVTSLIPPRAGLMGVSNSTLEVDEGWRTAGRVIPELAEMGLEAAGSDDYREWLNKARQETGGPVPGSGDTGLMQFNQ